jgi:hypothetical protein
MFKNLIMLLLACGLWQCTEVSEIGDDIGREYYPVKVGNYWIYDVSETTLNNQFLKDAPDSITYQVRERVDTIFKDQTGELAFRVIRSTRLQDTQPWGNDSILTIHKSLSDLRYTRDNVKTVKLVFPPRENKTWNGNAFNYRDAEEYSFAQVGQPFTLGDTTYANTVRVIQGMTENMVTLDDRQEVYALGVGLVYKRTIDYSFEGCKSEKCDDVRPGFVIYGRRIHQKLRTFGHLE